MDIELHPRLELKSHFWNIKRPTHHRHLSFIQGWSCGVNWTIYGSLILDDSASSEAGAPAIIHVTLVDCQVSIGLAWTDLGGTHCGVLLSLVSLLPEHHSESSRSLSPSETGVRSPGLNIAMVPQWFLIFKK